MGPVTNALHKCYFVATVLMWFPAVLHFVFNIFILMTHQKQGEIIELPTK